MLTQRNAACQRIANSDNQEIKAELLPPLCAGESFATVGISHLTTSRQHLAKPAGERGRDAGRLCAQRHRPLGHRRAGGRAPGERRHAGRRTPGAAGGPGVTRRRRGQAADAIVGAVRVADGHGRRSPKSTCRAGACWPGLWSTSCGLAAEAGSLTTSALAVGVTRGMLARCRHEAERRPELVPIYEALEAECKEAPLSLYAAATGNKDIRGRGSDVGIVRQKANSLVLRAAQAYLAASKGAGFVAAIRPSEPCARPCSFWSGLVRSRSSRPPCESSPV